MYSKHAITEYNMFFRALKATKTIAFSGSIITVYYIICIFKHLKCIYLHDNICNIYICTQNLNEFTFFKLLLGFLSTISIILNFLFYTFNGFSKMIYLRSLKYTRYSQ